MAYKQYIFLSKTFFCYVYGEVKLNFNEYRGKHFRSLMLSFVFDSTFSLCFLFFNYIIMISQAGFRNRQLYLAFRSLRKQYFTVGPYSSDEAYRLINNSMK